MISPRIPANLFHRRVAEAQRLKSASSHAFLCVSAVYFFSYLRPSVVFLFLCVSASLRFICFLSSVSLWFNPIISIFLTSPF